MAAVIPLIATFAGGVASGVGGFAAIGALATSGVAGFLSVAGGVLGTLGAVTGNKKMGQLGALMGLGGALGGLAGAAGATTSAAGGAQSGMMGGLADLDTAAQASSTMADTAALAPAQYGGQDFGFSAAGGGAAEAAGGGLGGGFDAAPQAGMIDGTQTLQQAGQAQYAQPGQSLMQQAMQQGASSNMPMSPMGSGMQSGVAMNGQAAPVDPLAKAGSGMTMGEIIKSAGTKLSGIPDWIKANPELTKIGGQMLASMYGPQAEQLDWQKSIMARRLANMNSPVRMGIRDPAPAPIYGG